MLRKSLLSCLSALVVWLASAGGAARADIAHLTLQSQPGDFIGQGHDFDLTYTTPGTQTVIAEIRRSLPGGAPAELLFTLDQNVRGANTFAQLFFGTDQLGIPFQAGVYGLPGDTAQRADFAQPGHAGLDVTFQNRGSNTLTGNFTVNSVSFFTDAGNVLRIGSLDVTFEQHYAGGTPALFGHFVFQSSAAVPEPTSFALLGLGLMGTLAIRRKTRAARRS